ncbi:MAG: D-glycero-beta-D-manno-heptose 1-phosphate adenylyltransferase [Nitrospirales bacterium]|nr:D-glycero-beta-D-manno-heptose 1-phosphate adenylyltransferase [Nitrospirales bacterium]
MGDKIQLLHDLSARVANHRRAGERVVFTNGCFDLLHIGHTRYLQAAKQLGDILIVAVNSDVSVHMLGKGDGRPINPEDHRMEVLAALTCVDYVTLFHEADPLPVITKLKPDVLVKGSDWSYQNIIGRECVESSGGTVTTIPMVQGLSTTVLVQKIQNLPLKQDTE